MRHNINGENEFNYTLNLMMVHLAALLAVARTTDMNLIINLDREKERTKKMMEEMEKILIRRSPEERRKNFLIATQKQLQKYMKEGGRGNLDLRIHQ
jgi:hypothetical protein